MRCSIIVNSARICKITFLEPRSTINSTQHQHNLTHSATSRSNSARLQINKSTSHHSITTALSRPVAIWLLPPLVEIWYLPSFLGKRATYTSQRPDSLEEYATQRQSGENCPSLHYSIRAWVAVAEQGFFATASATVLWNWGLKRVPASQAVIFVNLEPLVGAILGVSLLHEDLGIMALAGGALILGGAMYFSYRPERGSP